MNGVTIMSIFTIISNFQHSYADTSSTDPTTTTPTTTTKKHYNKQPHEIAHFEILEDEYVDTETSTKFEFDEFPDVLKYSYVETKQSHLARWSNPPLRYDREDWFYDRIVTLTLDTSSLNEDKQYTNVAPGVLISENQVLTTFNPFRDLMKKLETRNHLYVTIQLNRFITITSNGTLWRKVDGSELIVTKLAGGKVNCEYHPQPNWILNNLDRPEGLIYRRPDLEVIMGEPCGRILGDRTADYDFSSGYIYRPIACARQIVPVANVEESNENDWHGARIHSPLHDLMVATMTTSISKAEQVCIGKARYFEEKSEQGHMKYYTKIFYHKPEKQRYRTGPCITTLAGVENLMGRYFSFASFGHRGNESAAQQYNQLQVEYYDRDIDKVLVNCSDYLPNHWGRFICILDDREFVGFGSGTMLFSRQLLFGFGSFTFYKGKTPVLVFTDVRPYSELIFNTCTSEDLSKSGRI